MANFYFTKRIGGQRYYLKRTHNFSYTHTCPLAGAYVVTIITQACSDSCSTSDDASGNMRFEFLLISRAGLRWVVPLVLPGWRSVQGPVLPARNRVISGWSG